MAKFSRILRFLKLNNYHSHFAVELLLLTIMITVAVGNLLLKANLKRATALDTSLLFSYIQNQPAFNPRLAETYATPLPLAVGQALADSLLARQYGHQGWLA